MEKYIRICPRCKGPSNWMTLSTLSSQDERDVRYSVICLDCLLKGPQRETQDKAIEKWNEMAIAKDIKEE
jgi:hypothetical protein